MPLFMDVHKHVPGLTADAVAGAHQKDLSVQDKYQVKYLKYWFNEATGDVFCLSEAPDKESAVAVHREAHGLIPDEVVEVREGH
jgi:Nickel responsive protein SCO4226-like